MGLLDGKVRKTGVLKVGMGGSKFEELEGSGDKLPLLVQLELCY